MIKKIKFSIVQKGFNKVYVNGKPLDDNFTLQNKAIAKANEELLKGSKDVRIVRPDLFPTANLEIESDSELLAELERLKEIEKMYLQVTNSSEGGGSTEVVVPNVKAFPSAIGDGAEVTGGRGGTIVHVTNLNDSGTGSLREALTMTVPRIIIVDVGGKIDLVSIIALNSSNGDFTLAGQTASEGGLTIDGARVYFDNVSNVICRYVRFKGGIDGDNDSVTATLNQRSVIFDHCTFAFGDDEGASWYTTNVEGINDKVTIQRCLFGENPKASIIGVGADDLTLPSPTTPISASFVFNLFYNSGYRFPNISGREARFDVINNVVHRSSARLIRGNGDYNLNHIGNHYNYTDYAIADERINLHRFGYVPQIYTDDNFIIAPNTSTSSATVIEMNAENKLMWRYFQDGDEVNAGSFEIGEDYTIPSVDLQGTTDYTACGASDNNDGTLFTATSVGSGTGIAYNQYYGEQLPDNHFTDTQFSLLGESFTILSRTEAFTSVTNDVGCNKRLNADGSVSTNLDTLDASWIDNVKTETFAPRLNKVDYNVPAITSTSRPVDFYVTNSHIPESWFKANVPTGEDETYIMSSGYSAIEEYLNQVDLV